MSMDRRACCSPVVMVVPLIENISGEDGSTYVVYGLPHGWHAQFAMPACSGPRQLKFGDYQLVAKILGVLGMTGLHLWHYPIIFNQDFCI